MTCAACGGPVSKGATRCRECHARRLRAFITDETQAKMNQGRLESQGYWCKCRFCGVVFESATEGSERCSNVCGMRAKRTGKLGPALRALGPTPIQHEAPPRPKYNRWPPEALALLDIHYGMMGNRELANLIRRTTGIRVTIGALQRRAQKEGLKFFENQGHRSVPNAAREIGVDVEAAYKALTRLGLTTVGRARRAKWLTEEAFEALRRYYAAPSEPTVGIYEAASRLGYNAEHLRRSLRSGAIRSVKHKGYWRVPVAEVERILAERRSAQAA